MKDIKSVWILGSTSEIAKEICYSLAKKGCKKFCLLARNKIKNEKFISKLKRNFSIEIESHVLDLQNKKTSTIHNIKDYDLYIISAGYLGSKNKVLNEELKIIDINFLSLIPWIKSIVTKKRITKKGALWIFSSVAGDRGRPSNYQYGAAKSALTIYCEGLAQICSDKPFSVRILKAGLIKTQMSRNTGPPFLFTSKKKIVEILLKNPYKNGVEYIPYWWSLIMTIIKFLPSFIIKKL
tara:strand:+ start:520 stop:1233 length:714 start_codon:yes stop_codon:yes gene_type:complete